MKLRLYAIAGLVLMLAVSASWWLVRQAAPAGSVAVPVQLPEPPPAPAELPLPEGQSTAAPAKTTPEEFARRIKLVPDTRPERDPGTLTTDERDVTADNIDELILANLDEALDGSMASAYFVTRSRMNCDRFPSTPEKLEETVRNVNWRMQRARERGHDFVSSGQDYDHPWAMSDNEADNRQHLERWYGACQRVRAMFTPDLRRQLELLARKGDVMARYLYATWPEDMLDAGKAFGDQYSWESKAREFSVANLYAGEIAGLMAFGHSYLNGLFTARNGDLALAFGVAALNCGFETISIRSYLASSIDHLTTSDDPDDLQRLEFILGESDNLTHFCSP